MNLYPIALSGQLVTYKFRSDKTRCCDTVHHSSTDRNTFQLYRSHQNHNHYRKNTLVHTHLAALKRQAYTSRLDNSRLARLLER